MWGSRRLIAQARTQSPWSCSFCLQPHHVAADFKPLLAAVKLAFSQLAAQHCCTLMSAMPLVVVDGKWCLQVSLCNDRFSSQTWNKDLQAGFFSGCVARPARGSKYCVEHSRTSSSKSEETSTQCIVGHRERAANGALRVEFKLGEVAAASARVGDLQPRTIARNKPGTVLAAVSLACDLGHRANVHLGVADPSCVLCLLRLAGLRRLE